MIKSNKENPISVDIRKDLEVLSDSWNDGDCHSGVSISYDGENTILSLGNLKVIMTEDQLNRLEFYFKET